MLKLRAFLLMVSLGASWAVAGQAQASADHATAAGANAGGTAVADTRTEKQKALADQIERLHTMATELKAQVDLTNKNILSLKVVQKAEEIEALAKGMRGQGKK